MSVISDCEGHCSHFYICKYREEYQKHNNKKLEVENLPDFIVADISLLCSKQDMKKAKNCKHIRLYHFCKECNHNEYCKNKEGYQKIENELKDNKTIFELRCPFFEREEGSINGM